MYTQQARQETSFQRLQSNFEPGSEGARVAMDYSHEPGLEKGQGFKKQGQYETVVP